MTKLKVGEGIWAVRGNVVSPHNRYVIIGAPGVAGTRYLSVAPEIGGEVASYPENAFASLFYRVDEPEQGE